MAVPESIYEPVEYVISLREGLMDAWDGIILAMKSGNKRMFFKLKSFFLNPPCLANFSSEQLLQPYIQVIFRMLHVIYQDPNRSEPLLRTSMGVVGYVKIFTLIYR
jgi:importin subunit beta-1